MRHTHKNIHVSKNELETIIQSLEILANNYDTAGMYGKKVQVEQLLSKLRKRYLDIEFK